uniref:Arf-GAP domain-containing protein n=1 Tax=Entomoneis paludosa TaxID=265537 RepID=A0A7S2Y3B6_9STRA|mmetsp:Transcript_15442/g.31895  ORF Transcript_15442/g.31895 Transcript_15442/m.31895 type:complete len:300 (+) Transcript_15442:171-1070(+)
MTDPGDHDADGSSTSRSQGIPPPSTDKVTTSPRVSSPSSVADDLPIQKKVARRLSPTSSTTASDDVIDISILEMASREIEQLRQWQHSSASSSPSSSQQQQPQHITRTYKFPSACWTVLQHKPGNESCVDCGARNPQWGAVSYGALVCLHCSGYHRSLGVQVSCVRSVIMDEWSLPQILAMLEGGNAPLTTFFQRHLLCRQSCPSRSPEDGRSSTTSTSTAKTRLIHADNVTQVRYRTKAALFYRQQLQVHVQEQFLGTSAHAVVYQAGRREWVSSPTTHPQKQQQRRSRLSHSQSSIK